MNKFSYFFLSLTVVLFILGASTSKAEIDGTKYVETIILNGIYEDYRSCLKREPTQAELVKHYEDYQKDRSTQGLKDSICGASRLKVEQEKEKKEREGLLEKGQIIDPIQVRQDVTHDLLDKPTSDTDRFIRRGAEPVTDRVREAEDLVRRDAREVDQFVREGLKPLTDLVRREQQITKQILDIPINGVKKAFSSVFGGDDDEPRMSKKKAEAIVIEVYKKCLKRSPDTSGMAEYSNRLMYSWSEQRVEADVCSSSEAIDKNDGEPLVTDNTKLKTDTASIVKRVYLQCLDRQPDASGMSTYSRALSNGKSESWLKKELCSI